MKILEHSQMRGKLFIGLFVLIGIMVVGSVVSYLNISSMREMQENLYKQEFSNALDLKDIRANQGVIREDMMEMMITDSSSARNLRLEDIKERTAEIETDIRNVSKRLKDDPELFPKFQAFVDLRTAFTDTRTRQVVPLILAGKTKEAQKLAIGIQAERNKKMREITDDLIERIEKRVEERIRQSRLSADHILRLFIVLGLIVFVLGVVIAFFLDKIIKEREGVEEKLRTASSYSRSLLEASLDPLVTISPEGKITDVNDATVKVTGRTREGLIGTDFSNYFTEPEKARAGYREVFEKGFVTDYPLTIRHAEGKLTHVLYNASVYKDAEGRITGVFAAARDVTERKRAEESLKNVMQAVQDSVNVLAPATSEILTTTTQVASTAVETATAVSETTTTVEEVKQTALVANQKAQYVAEIAQKTAQASQSGKKSVEDSIDLMGRIREQMESIAESIVRLSEQGQTIGEIISTVNDLAEQSNLLAVNAAIEAARAGEQGKGFSVVAQEVRSLAEQSKQATAQVRSILMDIQKATTSAVMATEQGSKAVEAGEKQSSQAGESIRILAQSITEAAQASTQIVASSKQQLIGMDQIVNAMENIKQASEQNVVGTKQTETAAHNLHELGQKLKKLVELYKG